MMPLWMTLAWLLALLCALVAVWPWIRSWRRQGQVGGTITALNIQVFEERLAELQQDHQQRQQQADPRDQAALAQEYADQQIELKRQLLASQQDQQLQVHRMPRALVFGTLFAIPLLGMALYGMYGFKPAVADYWQAIATYGDTADGILSGQQTQWPQVNEQNGVSLLQALQSDVWRHPHDPIRWQNLSKAYLSIEGNQEALDSLQRAYRLQPDDPETVMTYAQTRFMVQQRLDPQTEELVRHVLTLSPQHEGALMLLAMGEFRQGRYTEAITALSQLKGALQARGNPNAARIDDAIGQAQLAEANAAKLAIPVSITLSPTLASQVDRKRSLFIFVRAAQGMPMPYAARQIPVSELNWSQPVTLKLMPQDAMMPERTLRNAIDEGVPLVVGARIGAQGQAVGQAGDWESAVVAVTPGQTHTANLIIDRIKP